MHLAPEVREVAPEAELMQSWQTFLFGCLCSLPWSLLHAEVIVVRDSIGPDSSATDGLPGGFSSSDGGTDWFTPGMVVTTPQAGVALQARFVVFGVDFFGQALNDIAGYSGFPYKFHLWTNGVEGGVDSFDLNPQGLPVAGHRIVEVNTLGNSAIAVQQFGNTGPPTDPQRFTTFLITVDLSSFNIQLNASEYVMGLIVDEENAISPGSSYLISGSSFTGFEDVFRQFDTPEAQFPGYVSSQLVFPFEQYAAFLSIENGDFDLDNDVDGADFLGWQRGESPNPLSASDLAAWQANFGYVASPIAAASSAVPEPVAGIMLMLGMAAMPLRHCAVSGGFGPMRTLDDLTGAPD